VVIGVELGAVLWVTRWLRNREGSLADVGLKVEWFGRELVLGVMAGTLIWFAGSVPSWVLDLVFGYQVPGVQPVFALGVGSPFQILLIAVIAFGEEVLWRGYAITELHRHYRLSVSVFVAVAGYGAFYLSQAVYTEWISVPWALWVGGSLSLLYLWRRSLVAPIIARWIVGYLG
jgi:membrane protease YdiL (CAAX protease family)